MQPVVRIPDPCHEDWNAMQPEAGGRHCAACSRLVVDFTDWEPEAIAAYLKAQAGTRVCGRFLKSVVAEEKPARPWLETVFAAAIPLLRKIAAVMLAVFGTVALSSCGGTADKPATPMPKAVSTPPTDTAQSGADPCVLTATLGEPALATDTPTPTILGRMAPPPGKKSATKPSKTGAQALPIQEGPSEVVMGAPPMSMTEPLTGTQASEDSASSARWPHRDFGKER